MICALHILSCKNDAAMQSATSNAIIPVSYPVTDTDQTIEDYHGTTVADPYRWLEQDTAARVEAWVKKKMKLPMNI